MMRRQWTWAIALAGMAAGLAPAVGQEKEKEASPELAREQKFLQGLRERGYYDLALEHIEQLRQAPDTPADLKAILDFEEGRGLLDEASHLADLEHRTAQLDRARAKLDAFTKAHPDHPLAPEALVQTARLLFARGQNHVLQANDADAAADKNAQLARARASFEQARKAYDQALGRLKAAYDRFPKFLPGDDPRKALRDQAHVALMDADLQRALVDYEEAQTYEPKADQRKALLDKAQAQFEETYKRYRTQIAGRHARMWQAKCYEEKGELGPAMGIYKELMDDEAPELRDLRRHVAYFQVIVDGKRGEHPLAVDRAAEWLQRNPNARNTPEGLGVQLELARNILAQVDEMKESDREAAIRRATDILKPVARVNSPSKPVALALLQKYRPKAAAGAQAVAGMTYENAYAEGEGAIQTHEWDRAVALFRHAARRADPTRKVEEANKARYMMAFALYQGQRYYESAVVGEHLARNYPRWDLAPKSAEIAIAAVAGAYSTYTAIDRTGDLDHLVELSTYVAGAWPDTEQGDFARTILGEVDMGRGRYLDAAKAFESVRPASSRRLEAQIKAGDCHYRQSQALRDQGKAKEADAEVAKAEALLKDALEARKKAGVPVSDPGLITNVNALAEVYRATGRPKDALALLEPMARELGATTLSTEASPLYEALLTVLLKSHISNNEPAKSIADMQALEKAGSSKAKLTQLYFELSKSLQKEMDAQKARRDPAYRRTEQAYKQFLAALASSQAGQSYDSLMFAGQAMLQMGMSKEAAEVFDRTLKAYENDPEFQKIPRAAEALLLTRLRLAEALRKQKRFQDAETLLEKLIQQQPRLLEPRIEQGLLLEGWAEAEHSIPRWKEAYAHWRKLAAQLERARPRPVSYYEAMYHVALALKYEGKKAEAAQTLKSIMALSPSVGNPEMKKRYQDFVKGLGL
jgi:cellulose synthase operon protein C